MRCQVIFDGMFYMSEFLWCYVVLEVIYRVYHFHLHEGQKFIVFKNQIQFSSLDGIFFFE